MTTSDCWVEGAAGSGFDVDHLPFGVFITGEDAPRVGARIGDFVLDLAPLAVSEGLHLGHLFVGPTLNPFLGAGHSTWHAIRIWLQALLADETVANRVRPHLRRLANVQMVLPFEVADYVDFYSSLNHATNVGRIFRPDEEPLKPNWRHLPVGYHGRSGTVVVSGTDVVRPWGQRRPAGSDDVLFGPSTRLDIEAELGFVVGTPSRLGTSVSTEAFAQHVFGVALVNDWSARDIQAWEYVPLGPFLGKSFATSISPWVTPIAALETARVALPGQDPAPLPYLAVEEPAGYDIELEVVLNGTVVSYPPYRSMYWSPAQMLAHMTINGASLRTGDLFASGTISGPERAQSGSFLELSQGGAEPFEAGGSSRTFLEDGDTVTLRATARGTNGGRISLGEVTGQILPAHVG